MVAGCLPGFARLIRISKHTFPLLSQSSSLSTPRSRSISRSLVKMQWASLAAVALFSQNVAAQGSMLRFACSQLTVDRIDPLVNPGSTYTPHLHQIVGGNSLNVTMDPSNHDPAALSTCTSCNFKEDLSNYWTAVMFFKAKNGTYKRVPQVGNGGPQGQLINNGGLDVYYIPSGKTTAFKPVSQHVQIS